MIAINVATADCFGVTLRRSQDGARTEVQLLSRSDLRPLPRAAAFPPPPGQWFRARGNSVMMCCPTCRALVAVSPAVHTVEDDGAVTPSWVCSNGCGYHEWVRLDGWAADPGTEVGP